MRSWVGIVIGLVVGAGAMYLALRPPWAQAPSPPSSTPVAIAPADAGVPNTKPKKKRRRPSGGGSQPLAPGVVGEDGYYEETEPPAPLTAADRALEWRGDAVALAPTKLDMAGGGDGRPLDDSEINATISSQADGVRDCVIQGAMGTDLRARITVQFIVDGAGRVSKSRVRAPHYLFEKDLLSCARRALGRMKFPATGAPTKIDMPVDLT
ncbi:MAG: hypothetical protein AB7O24_31855 [Kofleriaceae bacterium]